MVNLKWFNKVMALTICILFSLTSLSYASEVKLISFNLENDREIRLYGYDYAIPNKIKSYSIIHTRQEIRNGKKVFIVISQEDKAFEKEENYLSQNGEINWDQNLTSKVNKIIDDKDSKITKAYKVYQHIRQFEYDYNFDTNNNSGFSYIPNNENTMTNRIGVCYDFAVLYTSMMRSIGIETKLTKGYIWVENEKRWLYHAWNEVYVNERWIQLDVTWSQWDESFSDRVARFVY